ncbi:recombinase rad51 [Mycoblastus sanguinarius]|nr:recombinase rad51 [Mycoblastus sanguinarius]
MSAGEADETQSAYGDGGGGPGAPTPLSMLDGVAGLSSRDIKLIVEGGFNTVESVAYTWVSSANRSGLRLKNRIDREEYSSK